MHNVQKYDSYIIVPSSKTYRFYLENTKLKFCPWFWMDVNLGLCH
jgi:hypothetical protein